jgi:hypothetical protein
MRFKEALAPIAYLGSNWISMTGVALVTTAGILWLFLLPSLLRGGSADPYLGIVEFMILPGVFFLGLGLIPLGIWWYKKRNAGKLPEVFPPISMANQRFRKFLAFLGGMTVVNLIIGTHLAFSAVHYMESVNFCGQTCHVVMKPEFTAYQNSPHSRVPCVSCHIGPGANWFVKSKLSGSWQVISVSLNLYPRPIPTPIENLRPARETCEICHWPQKFGGTRLRVLDKFADDEKNTESKTVLLMKIGGGRNSYYGIHGAHMGPGVEIKYGHSDQKRQEIPYVEYSRNGDKLVFKGEKYKDGMKLEYRTMDCIDCHTRPSHTFETPHAAVDREIAEGDIDRSLPFVKKIAMEAIQKEYATTAEAEKGIVETFRGFYQKSHPAVYESRKDVVEKSAKGVLAAFNRNIFPEMKVKWGSYPNMIGHEDYPGCFRCHDERAANKGEKTITQDCNACHQLLAQEEQSPKVLTDLGLAETN